MVGKRTRTRPPFVCFCCNNPENGALETVVKGIACDDLFELEGEAAFFQGDWKVTIGGMAFPLARRMQSWVGNWCWNGAPVQAYTLARMLEHLRDSRSWQMTAGYSPLFDLWYRTGPVSREAFLHALVLWEMKG